MFRRLQLFLLLACLTLSRTESLADLVKREAARLLPDLRTSGEISTAPLTPSGETEPDTHLLSRHAIMYRSDLRTS